MKYSKGYKYQLEEMLIVKTTIYPDEIIDYSGIRLLNTGILILAKGFAWDGASGAIDTENSMKAACCHDAFYKLLRQGLLRLSYRPLIDQFFYEELLKAGMCKIRAKLWLRAVRKLAEKAAVVKRKIYSI